MPITAGTTLHFNDLPPYLQSLLQLNKMTPFVNMAGQKNGVRVIGDKVFDLDQVWSVGDGEQTGMTEQESVDGVSATRVTRSVDQNGIQLFQHKPQVSFLRESITGGASTPRTAGAAVVGSNQVDPVSFQIEAHLQKIQKDMDFSALLGTLNLPTASSGVGEDFTMGGIIPAITTNAINAAGALSKSVMNSLFVEMADNGVPFTDIMIVVSAANKVVLTDLYGLSERDSFNFGGVRVETLVTDFGLFPIMIDQNIPSSTVLVADMAYCKPVVLPYKGESVYVKPMDTNGASTEWLIYMQGSFDYGSEQVHGKVTGIV